ncbi:MAG: tetratricopeptide repeat protein [Myxococcota bacterium]
MAIKIKKKGRKTDNSAEAEEQENQPVDPLEEPDQFIKTADSGISWMANNQQALVIGVVAIVLAIVAGFAITYQMRQASLERAGVLTEAIDAMNAPVIPPPKEGDTPKPDDDDKDKDKGLTFDSEEKRYKTMEERADAVLSAYGSDDVATPARLVKAQAAFGLGRYDEAITIYDAWLKANPNARERTFILQAQATAQAAAGKAEDAIGTLNTLKNIDAEAYGELVSYQTARIHEAAGDKEKAKSEYEAFVKDYPESDKLEIAKMRLDML